MGSLQARKEIDAHREEIVDVLMKESGKAYSSANGEINATMKFWMKIRG